MHALDWIFLAVFVVSIALGMWRGLVFELLSVLGWVASFVLAQWFAPVVAVWLPMEGFAEGVRHAAAFVLILVAGVFAFGLLAALLSKLAATLGLRPADRLLGAVFGFARALVMVLVVAVVVHATPLRDFAWWQQAASAPVATAALVGIRPALPDAFGKYLPSSNQ